MSVNLGSTFKQLIDEINSKSDGNIDLSGKTNTSVLPNDIGEIKTKFRIAQKGYTGTSTWYYPIFKFPANNNANYASAIVTGRIGGWESGNMSYINALLWNRGNPAISLIDIAGTASNMSSIWNIADIVLYVDTDATATIYIKCSGYFTFDIDLELFQSTASIVYDGSHITATPSGTLTAQASTSTKRLELVNGKLLANGQELQVKLTAGNNITISGTTISATQPTVDSALSDSSTNAVQNKVVKEALDGKQASGNYVKYTAHSNVTAGKKTGVTTYTYEQSPMVVSNGMIIGGTAHDAGLVTRGISGASTPDTSTGACSTDHLYVNFDGNRKYSRYMILGAGETGADITTGTEKTTYAAKQYGTLMSAVRGDQMVNYVSDKLANVPTADDLSEIKAAVAGKAQSYILSVNDKFSTGSTSAKWYDKAGNDITSSIGSGNYIDSNCKNSTFNDAVSNLKVIVPSDTTYLIFRLSNDNTASLGGYDYLIYSTTYINTTFNIGDNIYIIETAVPDRWFGGNSIYYALEGKPLANYAVKDANNTFTGTNQHKQTEYFYKGITASNDSNLSDIATYKYNGITAGEYNLTFPSKSGTLAVTDDIDIRAANDNVFTGTENIFKRIVTDSGTEITYKIRVDPMVGIYTYPANSDYFIAYTNTGIKVKNATGVITYQLPSGSGTDYKSIATLSDLNSYVNLTGKQTISGAKTFTGDVTVDGGTFKVSKTDSSNKTMSAVYGPNAITYTPYGSSSQKLISLPSSDGTIALTSDIPSTSNLVTTNTEQTITAVKTFNAPANVSGTQQITTKFKTSNGGSISIGKEGPNSGTMLAFKQDDSKDVNRLLFRASATAGAMVWEQPEAGAVLYFDLGNDTGSGKNRIRLRSKQGDIALTNELPAAVSANPTLAGTESELTSIKIGSTSYKLPSGAEVSQPDYNQNDESASDYIKNRPFYSGYDVSAALFDQTVDVTTLEVNEDDIWYIWTSTSTIPYIEGAIVQLIVDGEKYACEIKDLEGGIYVLGNIGILEGADTGEPCLVIFNFNLLTQEAGATIAFKEAKTTSHVQIVPESINYLDPKYIKDMYYTETKTDNVLNTTFTTSVDSNGRNSWVITGEEYGLVSNHKHKVVYKGTTYIQEYKTTDQYDYIGNLSIVDSSKENTGEPFLIASGTGALFELLEQANFGIVIVTNEAQTDASIEITADYDVIHYLDDKYINAASRLKTWIENAQETSSFSIPTPSKNTDLVDKQYVDNFKITSINGLAGGVLTSPLVIDSTAGLNYKPYTDKSTSFPLIQYDGQEITIGTVASTPLKIIGRTDSTIGGIKFNEIATKTEIPNIEEYSKIRWLSYNDTFSMTTYSDAKWYDTRGNEITAQIGTGDYVDSKCGNSLFNSTEDVIELSGSKSLIFRVATKNGAIVPDKYIVSSIGYTIHAADIICLVENDVPDRKAIGPDGVTYTVLKAKMINGAALDKVNTFTKINTFNLGIQTVDNDASTTYKCGTIQYQYGSNNFTLTLPTAAGTLATQEYVATQIGNIDTLLTALNSGTGV